LTIPVASIAGTAVEGASQRGGDFLPLPPLRTRNWKARWQRLRAAQERLAVLPPIDVLQTADGYWVVDGHNRVAAALYGGQDDIDAIVTHVHLTGDPEPRTEAGAVAAGLVDAADLKAAGAGRLARGATVRPRRIARSEGPGEVGR
jgi:ParB-like chromosome segregation protein Spo0J